MHPRETLTAAQNSGPDAAGGTDTAGPDAAGGTDAAGQQSQQTWQTRQAAPSPNGHRPAQPTTAPRQRPMDTERFAALSRDIMAAMNTVIDGKEEAVELALTVMLARGHLLLEDVPGVGKTLLAKALARTLDCTVSRIQFTPDLLPSDITGVSIYNQSAHGFEFRPGAIFANLVIGDEINRASAKTQSALLESMEEHQVTVDGTSYALNEPFMVVATQNPIEMEGTYPLPEAQRDRFMARISMGYPDTTAELAMLETHQSVSPLEAVRAVATTADVAAMLDVVAAIHVSAAVKEYTVALGQATRTSDHLRLGASPRALLQLLRAAKASAALAGRRFVLPDDIRNLAEHVLAHRLIVDRKAASMGTTAADVIADALARLPVPAAPQAAQTPQAAQAPQPARLPGARPGAR
ncbi:AAA family ATPase [Arthrobacter sp.]|uniref:AAA family ATPase n=1 Tax=Arthrobacter sp. TaxID=1667 RepID=UPI00258AFB26|nr:AAA family ATPase [Arthrobacter sp.]